MLASLKGQRSNDLGTTSKAFAHTLSLLPSFINVVKEMEGILLSFCLCVSGFYFLSAASPGLKQSGAHFV